MTRQERMVPELPELPRLSELPDLAESSEPIVLSELDAEVREAVAATRRKVAALHADGVWWCGPPATSRSASPSPAMVKP